MKPAREAASSRPKPCASLKKLHESCPFATPCGPRRKKNDRGQRSGFPSETSRFSPPLTRQRWSCPPPSPNLVRSHPIENYQALRNSAPCLSRAVTLPKATKLELGRGAHLKTPSSANHTAAASQPTGRIAKAASWLYLSRVSPALHPPERPSPTLIPRNQVSEGESTRLSLLVNLAPLSHLSLHFLPLLIVIKATDRPTVVVDVALCFS